MLQTIEKILEGDVEIIENYKNAQKYWKEILKKIDVKNTESLAKELSISQIGRFEHDCGGRWLGQEVMAVVGISQFFIDQSLGYAEQVEKAKLVYDAFKRSTCSIEVIGHASAVAKQYMLIDENEY